MLHIRHVVSDDKEFTEKRVWKRIAAVLGRGDEVKGLWDSHDFNAGGRECAALLQKIRLSGRRRSGV